MGEDAVSGAGGVPAARFAHSRGARIAYQDFGQRSPIVVAIPPMAQNIEAAWEWPDIRAMMDRFGSFCRWVQFDKRGTGASDRRSMMPGIDERVEDLRAVMDAAEIDRAYLYGASEGGPTCLMFAVTYPERVEGIVLHGSGPYTAQPDQTEEQREEFRTTSVPYADAWGTERSPVVDHFAPSLADNADFRAWHQRYERLSADRDSLLDLLHISLDVDVREILPAVSVPTLVLHRVDDPIIPLAWGREVAEGVPGAQLLELDGADHFAYAGDQGWLDELERFVTGSVRSATGRPRPAAGTRIQTLGQFAVEVDGEPIPMTAWGSRKARMLCKRLVAARGWPVLREELCDMLWPEEAAFDRLGPRLSVQLSHVRRVLGGGVVADRRTVALDLTEVSTDLEDLLGATDDRTIVACYQGDFLPQDVYDDWTQGPRDAARTSFLDATRRLATRAIDTGDTDSAVALISRALDVERYDETLYRIGIRAWLEADNLAAARQLHERADRAMAELGVDFPSFDSID